MNARESLAQTTESLRQKLDSALTQVIPAGAPVALVGYPSHPNVGDQAIWIGERMWLRRHGHPVVYVADNLEYNKQTLAAALPPGGVILLHGGGNFGDIWPEHQVTRERVIADFAERKIVQLPQSVEFRDPAALARAADSVSRAKDLTILVRDQRSYEIITEAFTVTPTMCPDCAWAIGPLGRLRDAEESIIWIARTDSETATKLVRDASVMQATDWTDLAPPQRRPLPSDDVVRRALWKGSRISRHSRTGGELMQPILRRLHDQIAWRGVLSGCNLLSTARVVVTDRMHAHILSTILGIPSVVVDTGYGKLNGCYDAWTGGSDWVAVAADSTNAARLARALLVPR